MNSVRSELSEESRFGAGETGEPSLRGLEASRFCLSAGVAGDADLDRCKTSKIRNQMIIATKITPY